ncbi:epoxide hydrolase family protein [Mycobacteroides chelonae]|jgi:pimeloyl-ACP methyl ester carboxylesterase|uniref:Epoxide hydrolase n=1 Tax=Mycobacteroides chelonae TaxID=1774 RepID=A0AB73LRB2_MYCCH|nr:epoxide hydrolase family protein [Mycobacteroides chelonae]MBF9326624.1 epoxide hydrolase [Mycobacteroides chelonae]MBF9420801.1 epoxide hydrolase [Mycobacteroides chelonae]MBF9437008.1 epoxide hydrolase [Mycobacteroides chelonae]MBV6360703.1 epoxide hydrolase [Mycobacteroides chelonae]MEC4833848.1 epoxide hydrolase [Mycobacteroides chelonae]
MEAITPFRIAVPQSELDDLQRRLDHARWPAPLPTDSWSTGVPTWWLRQIVEYWRTDYDWRAAEKELNVWPQFVTTIRGQRIHFLHIRSDEPDAVPLVLTHGWPGSVAEFLDIIGPLTNPRAYGGDPRDAFHVVIPSLPGFGFSGPVAESGWSKSEIASAWAELMYRLGYVRYGAHGGDIGSGVSPDIARSAPEHVIGVHVSGGPGPMPHFPVPDEVRSALSEPDRARLHMMEELFSDGSGTGYVAIQSTRPQTLAYGLTDSPLGQLAWIMEKFREWTYPQEALPEKIISLDRLLTNVMIYWLTGTAGSSAYVGYAQGLGWDEEKPNSRVPTGAIVFAADFGIRHFAETSNTITHWVEVDRGGHFAALEEPALLVDDIRTFYRALRD